MKIKEAPALPAEVHEMVRRLAEEPAVVFICELPPPPGINGWWEPITIRRGRKTVASMRLTQNAVAYKALAERHLLQQGVDVVALEDRFKDLWLRLSIVSYLSTPLERDVDGPVKPLQDFLCALLGANDARVRQVSASLQLDREHPRVAIRVEGYQVWEASAAGGTYFLLRTTETPEGRRSQALPITARRIPLPIRDFGAEIR